MISWCRSPDSSKSPRHPAAGIVRAVATVTTKRPLDLARPRRTAWAGAARWRHAASRHARGGTTILAARQPVIRSNGMTTSRLVSTGRLATDDHLGDLNIIMTPYRRGGGRKTRLTERCISWLLRAARRSAGRSGSTPDGWQAIRAARCSPTTPRLPRGGDTIGARLNQGDNVDDATERSQSDPPQPCAPSSG